MNLENQRNNKTIKYILLLIVVLISFAGGIFIGKEYFNKDKDSSKENKKNNNSKEVTVVKAVNTNHFNLQYLYVAKDIILGSDGYIYVDINDCNKYASLCEKKSENRRI